MPPNPPSLRVLLIDDGAHRVPLIRDELTRLGYVVVGVLDSATLIHDCVLQLAPDVVIVDSESPSRDTLEHLAALSASNPRPVVVFAEDGAEDPLRRALRAGVSAATCASSRWTAGRSWPTWPNESSKRASCCGRSAERTLFRRQRACMLRRTKSAPAAAREPSAGAPLWCRAGRKSQAARRIALARLVLTPSVKPRAQRRARATCKRQRAKASERVRAAHACKPAVVAAPFSWVTQGAQVMSTTHKGLMSEKRRRFIQGSAAVAVAAGVHPRVWAAGSDAPEKKEVRIGFIPLTDCASVVMASVLKFDEKYGIKIIPTKEASWAGVRDKLVNGELDMAHVLYGLVYGVHLGVGGPKKDMAVLMTLNNNGQAITLSKKLADKGAVDGASLAALMAKEPRPDGQERTFAQTFPTGTHAMWLYYWLASAGINPMKDAKVITVPPPQMVANMRVGNMDGYCVGEPWNHRAIIDGIGVTAVTTQDIWKDHPEKVLGATGDFVKKYPNTARAVIMAVLEASRWIDASLTNKNKMAETIAEKSYVNTSVDAINQRILGRYQNGLGKTWDDPNHMKFFNDGAVNYPYLSDGMWFLTQHKRWGLLKDHPDYLKVAMEINQTELYKQAATQLKVSVPKSDMRSSKLLDGVVWDGKDPAKYADSFKVKALSV